MVEITVDEPADKREGLFTRTFVLMLVTQTCFGMSFSAMFLLPKYLKLELAASDVQIGTLGSVGSICGVFAFPIVGHLNDRFGRKPFVLLGGVLLALTVVALLFIHEVSGALYLARALQGVSFALLYNSATTFVTDGVAPERMGRALAVFGASMLITNALSPWLAEPLAAHFGWNSVFGAAVAFSIASIAAASLVREAPRMTLPGSAEGGVLSLLREPRARRVAILIAAAGAGFGTVFTFHQPYAIALGIQQVSGFFVSYAVCALVVRLLLMQRVDSYGRRHASAVSMFVYALAVFGTAWLREGALELIGALMGLAQGVFYPAFNALAIECVPPAQRGSMMALYHGGFNAGMALILLVGGSLAEGFGYPVLFWFTGAVTATGAVVLWHSDVITSASESSEG